MRRLVVFVDCFWVFLVFVNISCGIGEVGVLILDFVEVFIVIDFVFQILDWKIKIDIDDKVVEVVIL